VEARLLRVSKIGVLRLVLHRPIEGTIKTLTLRRTSSGKWYACFSVETDAMPLPPNESAIGVDVGLTNFATLSTGEKIANPRCFQTDEKALAKAQRRLAKAEQGKAADGLRPRRGAGTPARAKCRKVVARIHERIANRRYDFCHQTARTLVNTHGVLAFEALQIPNMMQNHCLAKSIADVAWGQFVRITTDKAACAGRRVAHVDPRYTSQDCSRCGQRVPKSLSERQHRCPTCQLVLDRDHNAAINILRCGLASLGLAPRNPRF
jgi:putative transposase